VPIPLRWQWKIDRVRDAITGIFRSNPENARPRMCPACGTLVGTTATKCHVCGASIRFGMAAASRSLGRMMPTNAPVTYCILSLCCLLYGICLLYSVRSGVPWMPEGGGLSAIFNIGGIDGKTSWLLGATEPMWRLILDGQWWRLITAVFLHGSLMHIVFNMWVIMDIGPMVEELFGSARYLFLYIATGAFGYVISSLAGHNSVGASGALLGLIGLLLASTTKSSSASSQSLRSSLIKWVIYIAIMGFMFSGIDNYAHFGGLAAGFVLGKLFVDRPPQGQSEARVANILGWGTALVVIGCFALMMRFFLANR
jgi:membrane associated rhomboid family serine protease